MFGRKQPDVYIVPSVQGPGSTHHLHVMQQPSDAADSARLYGELLEKARAEVRSAVLERIPSIEAQFVRYEAFRTWDSLQDQMAIAFKVNGKEVHTRVEWLSDADGKEGMLKAISEALARDILQQMLLPMMKDGVL